MKSSTWPRGGFSKQHVDLLHRFGDEAADVRHELFYLAAGRTPVMAGLRALAALVRDMWLLLCRTGPRTQHAAGTRQVVMLTTLAGASGWGTLERSLPDILSAGYKPLILAHPRLVAQSFAPDQPVMRLARADVQSWFSALHVLTLTLWQRRPLLLACCLARRRLWVGSLRRTLSGRVGVLLLHNDFDLMSSAAIGHGLPAICLQHGIPTDEFFPTRADWYVVWGSSSRRAFATQCDSHTQFVEDAFGRGNALAGLMLTAPSGVALLSQTHAQVLGDGIHEMLNNFATSLLQAMPDASILLHPLEVHPYVGAAADAALRPPHPELQPQACACRLVIGYCSTAMLDAALAGHWVVVLELPLEDNSAARDVLAAPLRVETVDQLLRLYKRLHEDLAFRRASAEAQAKWLSASFSNTPGGFADLLQRITLKPLAECF